jgi:CheY-like chemotaxis protein
MSSEDDVRILIVDDDREQARALKMSLELMEQKTQVVDVPSGEEAMLEIGRDPFDLLVADYHLPGMTGIELIKRLRKKSPDLKALIITGTPLEKLEKEMGDLEVSELIQKPIDAEVFLNAVKAIVFGVEEEDAPAAKADGGPPESMLGPVPEIDDEPIARVIADVMPDLGAIGMAFISREGKILVESGQFDNRLKFGEIKQLLAYNFTRSAEITHMMGNRPSGAVHYYTGTDYDIYALAIGLHFFLAIIYPGGSPREMGQVLRLWRKEVRDMIQAIGEPALTIADGKAPPEKVEKKVKEEKAKEEKVEKKAEKKAEKEEPAKAAKEAPTEEEAEVTDIFELGDEDGEQIELDLDALDADLAKMDDLDDFWEAAAEEVDVEQAGTISIEEAMELGLIEDLED